MDDIVNGNLKIITQTEQSNKRHQQGESAAREEWRKDRCLT